MPYVQVSLPHHSTLILSPSVSEHTCKSRKYSLEWFLFSFSLKFWVFMGECLNSSCLQASSAHPLYKPHHRAHYEHQGCKCGRCLLLVGTLHSTDFDNRYLNVMNHLPMCKSGCATSTSSDDWMQETCHSTLSKSHLDRLIVGWFTQVVSKFGKDVSAPKVTHVPQ